MTLRGLRSLLVSTAIMAGLVGQARAEFVTVNDFSDLILWAGSGTNSAAFVLQFSGTSSPTSIAWGYRWNGTSTMQAMTDAIAGTTTLINGVAVPPGLDERLTIDGTQYSFGVFLSEIAYDQVGLPSGWSQTTRQIVNDFSVDGTYPTLYTNADADGSWLGEGEAQTMSFQVSQVGASDITLTPGGWYGFVQSSGPSSFAFNQPVAAVPEPSGIVLIACGGAVTGVMAWRRRRRRAA